MAILANNKDSAKITMIIESLDEYLLVRRALEQYVAVKVEEMSPKEKLSQAILSRNESRGATSELFISLCNQEKLIPKLDYITQLSPSSEYTEAEAIREAANHISHDFVVELPDLSLSKWWDAEKQEINDEVDWTTKCSSGNVRLRNVLLHIANEIEYKKSEVIQ